MPNKLWKSTGEEQKYLEKLFRDKVINATSKPGDVQKDYEIFHGFSAAVFRLHWSKTKALFGDKTSEERLGENVGASTSTGIPEIDGAPPPKKRRLEIADSDNNPTPLNYKKPPFVYYEYTDPITKKDKFLVVIQFFAGSKRVEFDIKKTEKGQVLTIQYEWPLLMFNPNDLFTQDDEEPLPSFHPKVLGYEKALEQFRANVDDVPEGEISFLMPCEVNLDSNTWTKSTNKKINGATAVFLEFLCVERDYHKRAFEKSIIL